MLAHVLLSLLVFEHGFIQIVLVFWNFLYDIFSIKLCTISFLCKHNFLLVRNIHNECWILKLKYFMKVFHVSWNDPETTFHEMLWKKKFTVYPSHDDYVQTNKNRVTNEGDKPTSRETSLLLWKYWHQFSPLQTNSYHPVTSVLISEAN